MSFHKEELRLETVNCNLCHSSQNRVVLTGKDRLHGFEESFNVVECQDCGLVYVNPRPTPETIGRYYPEDYFCHQLRFDSTKNSLRDKLFQNTVVKWIELDKIRELRSVCPITAQMKILDAGCGTGSFLWLLKTRYGCEVEGVEFSPSATDYAARCYDIHVRCVPFLEFDYRKKENYYDFVTMWGYLEHEFYPSEVLSLCRKILKDSGRLVIRIPNRNSLEASIFRNFWWGLHLPQHLYHFTPHTIKKMLEKQGFKIEVTKHNWPSLGVTGSVQLLAGRHVFKDISKNFFRQAAINSIFFPMEYVLKVLRINDLITLFAKKR